MLQTDGNLSTSSTARCTSDAGKTRSLHEKINQKVQGIGTA